MEYDIDTDLIGTKRYYKKGTKIIHREDGPAIERPNGDKAWIINGSFHKINGPAIEWDDGYKAWYINGKRHRIDGPAIEWKDGAFSWYINGERLSSEKEAILNKWWDNKNGI